MPPGGCRCLCRKQAGAGFGQPRPIGRVGGSGTQAILCVSTEAAAAAGPRRKKLDQAVGLGVAGGGRLLALRPFVRSSLLGGSALLLERLVRREGAGQEAMCCVLHHAVHHAVHRATYVLVARYLLQREVIEHGEGARTHLDHLQHIGLQP
eukprot:scaffold39791_cov60-Phaeocystis_antarctica.AAC.3